MTTFTSESNKQLIWNILEQNGTFNKLTHEHKSDIKERFNSIVYELDKTDMNETIINKNKNLILKITEVSNTLYNSSVNTKPNPITSKDIIDMRQSQFSDNLKAKQEEFDTFMKQKTPDEINFSDTLDKPIGSELDSMLSDAMARREMDLNNFPKPTEKNKSNTATNNFVPNLVIGQSIDISNESIKIENTDFKYTNQLNLILDKLNSLEASQIKIASQLTTIYSHITDSSMNYSSMNYSSINSSNN
tara:strand:- start:631 stop:1371 length:741 start_codon:yes stop_codon:yes gene_type:complete